MRTGGEESQQKTHVQAEHGVKASRIDVIFAGPEAVLYIHKESVRKNLFIPTHSAVCIEISRNAMKRKRLFARTLPPLKKTIEAKVAEDFEEEYRKEKEEKKRKENK